MLFGHFQQSSNWSLKRNIQSPAQKPIAWVDAAVLACNAWLVFDNDEKVHQWATAVLQYKKPEMRLAPDAPVEPIVGYPLHKSGVRASMYELLQFVVTRAGLDWQAYQPRFSQVSGDTPSIQVLVCSGC